jgi:hypothetical protein
MRRRLRPVGTTHLLHHHLVAEVGTGRLLVNTRSRVAIRLRRNRVATRRRVLHSSRAAIRRRVLRSSRVAIRLRLLAVVTRPRRVVTRPRLLAVVTRPRRVVTRPRPRPVVTRPRPVATRRLDIRPQALPVIQIPGRSTSARHLVGHGTSSPRTPPCSSCQPSSTGW